MSIPVERILAKEDEYLADNDYASAEKHLLYWWAEAEAERDERGKLLLCNELMGINRKIGKGDLAKEYAQKALGLVEALGFQNEIAGATAYLNAGTVYKAFDEPEQSLLYFEQAKSIYEKELDRNDPRKAGLYNNMALTLVDLNRFEEAMILYKAALTIVQNKNLPDEAITWLNIADLLVAEKGLESAEAEVIPCLDKAEAVLDSIPQAERNAYYAYVCEKCAPVFDYYGYFVAAQKYAGYAGKDSDKNHAGN